jgi:hypothetical protein
MVNLIRNSKAAQHSVHPTGGSLRVFRQFVWLEVGSGKIALSRPLPPAGNASRWAVVEREDLVFGQARERVGSVKS